MKKTQEQLGRACSPPANFRLTYIIKSERLRLVNSSSALALTVVFGV